MMKVGMIFLFLAGLDYLFQRWQHRKELMMTQQEVKEEYKEREGSPLIKSRIRSLQREMSRKRMIEDVKTADVIVTNPTHYAIALKYKPGEMHGAEDCRERSRVCRGQDKRGRFQIQGACY